MESLMVLYIPSGIIILLQWRLMRLYPDLVLFNSNIFICVCVCRERDALAQSIL